MKLDFLIIDGSKKNLTKTIKFIDFYGLHFSGFFSDTVRTIGINISVVNIPLT